MVDDAHRLVVAAGESSASEKAPRSPGRHRVCWMLLLLALALIARAYVTGGRMMSADDHADVCCHGFDIDHGSFVQAYDPRFSAAVRCARRGSIALHAAIMSSQRA